MGNSATSPEQLAQNYILTQETSGLIDPNLEQSTRLYKSLRFYSPRDKFFLLDKLFFFDQADAFVDTESLRSRVERNFAFYRQRLRPFEGLTALISRMSVQPLSLRRQFLSSTFEDRIDPTVLCLPLEKCWLIAQSLSALTGLHGADIPHCNLKPSNLLLTSNDWVMLADFSMLTPHFFLNQQLEKIVLCHPDLEDRCYLPPERFLDMGETEIVDLQIASRELIQVLKSGDVFAMGCIIYEMMTYKPLFNYRTLKNHGLKQNLPELHSNIKDKFQSISPTLLPLADLVFCMIDPEPNHRPTAKQALEAFSRPIFGSLMDPLLFFNFLTRSREMLLPDHRQLFRALFLEFLRRDGQFEDRLEFEVPLHMVFIKNIDIEGFFNASMELLNSEQLRVLFQGKTKGLAENQLTHDVVNPKVNDPSQVLEHKPHPKAYSLSESFDIINKDLTPNMIKRPTIIDPEDELLNKHTSDHTNSRIEHLLYPQAPPFVKRFARFLSSIRVQAHSVVKFKYHTLPSFEQVLHSVHHSPSPFTKKHNGHLRSEMQYREKIESMIGTFQTGFDPQQEFTSIWGNKMVERKSSLTFEKLNNTQLSEGKEIKENGDSAPTQEPESAVRMLSYIFFKELLLDLQNSLYSETMCWTLDIITQLSALVDPIVLVLYGFPVLQNLHKQPYRVSPLKLFRSMVRIAGNVQHVPKKILSSLGSLEDYFLVYLKNIFSNGNMILLSELISSLDTLLSVCYRFCFSHLHLTHPQLFNGPPTRVCTSRAFLVYSRQIKRFFSFYLSKLFQKRALWRPLYKSLPTLRAFICPAEFFSRLAGLFFNAFNKIGDRGFVMKYADHLIGNDRGSKMAFFDLFVKSLKSNDSVRVHRAAKNLNSVLSKYELLESEKALTLLRAAMSALQTGQSRPMQETQARELLSIIIKLARVIDPDVYRMEVSALFPEDPTQMEEIPIEELESLIQQYEVRTNLMGIKRRRSKNNKFKQKADSIVLTTAKDKTDKTKGSVQDLRVVSPEVLYENIKKLFVVVGYLNTLFKRQNKPTYEYTQVLLAEYERLFKKESALNVTLVEDRKDVLALARSSHYVLKRLLPALRMQNNQILEKPLNSRITQIESETESLARKYNRLMTLELATQLEGLLQIEKLDKQTEYWQLSDTRQTDKKLLRQFRPKGQCMATLYSNKGRLKVLARGRDDLFFSGSDEGEIRVYDFDKFTSEKETLLKETMDINELLDKPHNQKKNSFSTCPDT